MGSTGSGSVATTAERIAVLGILPVTQDLEVFGKASLNNVHTKLKIDRFASQTFNDTRLGLGFGAQYQLHKICRCVANTNTSPAMTSSCLADKA